jgi:hypothetical protein
MIGRIWLAASIGLFSWLVERGAIASSCESPALIFPSPAEHPLPANGRILVRPRSDESTFHAVRDPDGADPMIVPLVRMPAGTFLDEAWVAPAEPFDPRTPYRLIEVAGTGEHVLADFVTGAGPDEVPPTLGSVTVVPGRCGNFTFTYLQLHDASDDVTETSRLLLRIELEGPAETRSILTSAATSMLGGVEHPASWPDPGMLSVHTDVPYTATFTLLDWAGNESASTSPVTITFPGAPDATCECRIGASAAGRTPTSFFIPLIVVLLVLRRGSRRTPRRQVAGICAEQ